MSAKNVTVVIVACNQVQKTLDCLATVAALRPPPCRVLLLNNGPISGSRWKNCHMA